MSGFNLVDDPWIPLRADDGIRPVSLREALIAPERFIGLDTGDVDEVFGLLRLLTTVVNRALEGPRTPSEWAEIAYGDGYDTAAIGAYLDRWRHRFELFDPERPFLQYPELAARDRDHTLAVLLPSESSGNAITLFSHLADDDPLEFTPAEAARALAHVVLNGRGTLRSGEYGIFGARVALLGDSLRDLVVQNLPPHRGAARDGIPVWERERPRRLSEHPHKKWTEPCVGLMDLSTWQWRAVLLRRDPDGMVRRCFYGHGPVPDGEEPLDPARWYEVPSEEERRWNPKLPVRDDRRLQVDRDVWRDADALVAALASKTTATILSWNAVARPGEGREILVAGPIIEPKHSSITAMRSATLPLPRGFLRDGTVVERVRAAIRHAEARASSLRRATDALAQELARPAPGKAAPKRRVKSIARPLDARGRFWAALPPAFDAFLRALTDSAALDAWHQAVDAEARRALAEVISGIAATPRGLRAGAAAQRRLERDLRPAEPAPEAVRSSQEVPT